MSQFNTFFIDCADDGVAQERLNLFLRTHRVLNTRQYLMREGLLFAVETWQSVK